jgi:hypothetical protein
MYMVTIPQLHVLPYIFIAGVYVNACPIITSGGPPAACRTACCTAQRVCVRACLQTYFTFCCRHCHLCTLHSVRCQIKKLSQLADLITSMTSRYFPPFALHSAAATKVSVQCTERHPSLTDTLQPNSRFRNTPIPASAADR